MILVAATTTARSTWKPSVLPAILKHGRQKRKMTREEAVAVLEEVKTNDDSMFAYSEPYMIALDMAIDALKARETSLEKVASDYGLTVGGVEFALQEYQTVICEITHSRMSKLTYYARDILSLANDLQCDGCELKDPQEPIKASIKDSDGGNTHWYVCGACQAPIQPGDNFCHECGKPVKWDDR